MFQRRRFLASNDVPIDQAPSRASGDEVRDLAVVVLDTSVLFPLLLRDLLLDIAECGHYVAQWSTEILDELSRNLVEQGYSTVDKAARLIAAMNSVFPGALVTGYEHLIPVMTNHPKDRHVTAAAVSAKATIIVTTNLRDFPPAALEPWGLVAQSPDVFLSQLAASDRARIVDVLQGQAARYRAPVMALDHLLDRLALHIPTFVAVLREATS